MLEEFCGSATLNNTKSMNPGPISWVSGAGITDNKGELV